ncbi:MAG: purine-nucleoside phosphorylase [Planctomycetaceae bacterium]
MQSRTDTDRTASGYHRRDLSTVYLIDESINDLIDRAADLVLSRLSSVPLKQNRTAVILGSGLGHAAKELANRPGTVRMDYGTIPGMPVPGIAGHAGELLVGTHHDSTVFLLKGRVHLYEGHPQSRVTFATRLMHRLNVNKLIITNASGGIRPEFQPGDLMLISGHLEWPSVSLLSRPRPDDRAMISVGVPVSVTHRLRRQVWCADLRAAAASVPCSLHVHQGIYALMHGPCYETPAEVRAARFLGADAVGMSTVPEALVASELGLSVLGISCISNLAAGLGTDKLTHTDVTQTASMIEHDFTDWLWKVIEAISALPDCPSDESIDRQ